MPSFGILGIGGIVAFVTGSVILMDGSHRDISLPMVGGTAAVAAGFTLWTVTRFIGLRKRPPVSGPEQVTQEQAVALDDFLPFEQGFRGHVRLSGERWKAQSTTEVKAGNQVHVQRLDGLTVMVEPGSSPR